MIHKNKIFSLFRTYSLKKVLQISGILASAFLFGSLASRFTDHFFPASSRSVTGQEIHFGTATPRTEIKNSAEFIQKTASDLFAPSAVETASLSFSIADSDPALLDTLLLPSWLAGWLVGDVINKILAVGRSGYRRKYDKNDLINQRRVNELSLSLSLYLSGAVPALPRENLSRNIASEIALTTSVA